MGLNDMLNNVRSSRILVPRQPILSAKCGA